MAKTSKVVANEKRRKLVDKYAARRAELKEAQRKAETAEEAMEIAKKLAKLPRDASPTRLRNRSVDDGRPRGYLRKFGLSRVTFREMAHAGQLPGVTKSSW